MEGFGLLKIAGFVWTALRGIMVIAAHITQSQGNGMGPHIVISTTGDYGTLSGPYHFSVAVGDHQIDPCVSKR